MSDTPGEGETLLKQDLDVESDSNDKGCCCDCFLCKLKPLPKQLRFPIGLLRVCLILTLASLAYNILAITATTTIDDRYFVDLVLACIHVPVCMGLDILGNYLVFKAIVEGNKLFFAWFNVEAVFRIIIGTFGIVGLPGTGFGGLFTTGDLDDSDYDIEFGCYLSAYIWTCSTFVVLCAFIHFHIALCCLGGFNSVNAASVVRNLYTTEEKSTSINYDKIDVEDSAV